MSKPFSVPRPSLAEEEKAPLEGGAKGTVWRDGGRQEYLLTMGWFLLLSPMGGYGPQEGQPWLVPAVVVFTVSYGILMFLLWPHEIVSSEGSPERLVP